MMHKRLLRASRSSLKGGGSQLPRWQMALAGSVLLGSTLGVLFQSRPATDSRADLYPGAPAVVFQAAAPREQIPLEQEPASDLPGRDQTQRPSDSMILQDVSPWLRKARQGDAAAAIAVYETFKKCQPPGRQGAGAGASIEAPMTTAATSPQCQAAPYAGSLDFLLLLGPAAEGGDTAARLYFAAEVFGRNERLPRGARNSSQVVQEQTRTAVTYLEEAGAQGSAAALLQLARVFEAGDAVPQNLERAYSYRLGLSTVAPGELANTQQDLRRLEQRLTPSQIRNAQEYSARLVKEGARPPKSAPVRESSTSQGSSAVPPL